MTDIAGLLLLRNGDRFFGQEYNDAQSNMDQDEFVVFAELNRDMFDEILQALTNQFETIEYGRQGDDWIWVHLGDDKMEIDSFFSMNLEVKGKYKHFPAIKQILHGLKDDWMLQIFDPPKMDSTR